MRIESIVVVFLWDQIEQFGVLTDFTNGAFIKATYFAPIRVIVTEFSRPRVLPKTKDLKLNMTSEQTK